MRVIIHHPTVTGDVDYDVDIIKTSFTITTDSFHSLKNPMKAILANFAGKHNKSWIYRESGRHARGIACEVRTASNRRLLFSLLTLPQAMTPLLKVGLRSPVKHIFLVNSVPQLSNWNRVGTKSFLYVGTRCQAFHFHINSSRRSKCMNTCCNSNIWTMATLNRENA